jgi:hypothetical protein
MSQQPLALFAKTLTALAAPEDSGSGARKRPSDRFSR